MRRVHQELQLGAIGKFGSFTSGGVLLNRLAQVVQNLIDLMSSKDSISPEPSTVMKHVKSPFMAAVLICAKPRISVVKFPAMVLTAILFGVRSVKTTLHNSAEC